MKKFLFLALLLTTFFSIVLATEEETVELIKRDLEKVKPFVREYVYADETTT